MDAGLLRGHKMHTLGEKVTKVCGNCKDEQIFEVSRISEYGEITAICQKCKTSMNLESS